MGAKFGPAAYLWIVFGCIFAGAVHDYFSGMLSIRHEGAGLPEMIGHYLGKTTKNVMLVFTVCSTYVFISRQMLHLPEPLAYGLGIACLVVAAVWFTIWYNKQERNQQ